MTPSRLNRTLSAAFLLAAMGAGSAVAKDLPLRPQKSATESTALQGRARSYYAYCLSQQAMLVRDYQSARGYLEEAVAADPGSVDLQLELARVYLSLRRTGEAMEKTRAAARLEPENPEPRRLLVDLYRMELGRSTEPPVGLVNSAITAHRELLKLDPGDGDSRLSLARLEYVRGLYDDAVTTLRPHVAANPQDTDAAFLMARALTRSGRGKEALLILEAAVEAQPGLPELRAALAEAREAAGNMEGARSLLEALVKESPERSDYRFALARILELEGDHRGAARESRVLVEQFREAESGTRAEADLRAAMIFLIEATGNGGELDAALEMNLAAERRFPDDTRFTLKRAEILYLQRNDEIADSVLNGLAVRGPNSVPRSRLSMVLLRVGAREERQDDLDRAEWLLRRAIQFDSGNHAALNYLGYMLAERDRSLDEALDLIRRALTLDESNGAYQDSLGWALFRLGRLQEAEGHLVQAVQSIPNEAVVHDHLGDLYWAQGRQADAVKAWEKAIQFGVENVPGVEAKIEGAAADSKVR